MLPSFQQELAQVAQTNPLVVVAVALSSLSPLVVAFGAVANRKRGRGIDRERKAHETRMENGIKAVELKIAACATKDDIGELREETRRNTAALDRRVDGAFYLLTGGPDTDGPNGIRSRVKALEEEREDAPRPRDGESYPRIARP